MGAPTFDAALIVTQTALLKFAEQCPHVGPVGRVEAVRLLRTAIMDGTPIERDRLSDEINPDAAVMVELPSQWRSVTGDGLVAVVAPDQFNGRDRVVTTVRRLRSVLKPVTDKAKPFRAKVKPEPEPEPAPEETIKRQQPPVMPEPVPAPSPVEAPPAVAAPPRKAKHQLVKVKPAPPPVPAPSKSGGPDNRGALLARQEIARRRWYQWQLAQASGLPAHRISRLLSGVNVPTVAEAMAIQRAVGVPVTAWGEEP